MYEKRLAKRSLKFLDSALAKSKTAEREGIVDEIAKRKGTRLSPGTIYPSLDVLRQKGFVQVAKKIEKEKVYDLTADGKLALDEGKILFQRMFYDLGND